MTRTQRSSALLTVISLALAAAGCAARGPLALYPDFPDRKRSLGTVAVMTDVVVLEDIAGDIDKVDVVESKKIGEALLALVGDGLMKKGYTVGKTTVASVGQSLNPSGTYKVARTPDDNRLGSEALPLDRPPFYVEEAISEKVEVRQSWASMIRTLPRFLRRDPDTRPVDEAILLGREAEADAVMVVVAYGRNIPTGKQVAQGIATTVLTLGLVTAWQTSTTGVLAFVIDSRDGKVIWMDRRFKQKRIGEESVRGLLEDIIEALP